MGTVHPIVKNVEFVLETLRQDICDRYISKRRTLDLCRTVAALRLPRRNTH